MLFFGKETKRLITVYSNGTAMIQAYADYLNTNPYLSQWFFVDGPLITKPDRQNYAVSAGTAAAPLLCVRVAPFSTVLFGDPDAAAELLDFLLAEDYEISRFLTSETVGDAAVRYLWERHGLRYQEALGMDFMEAREITEPSCDAVSAPESEDLPEIIECLENFILDCGLEDSVDEASQRETLSDFRILRADGKIASMAKLARRDAPFDTITNVYTRPEYRGHGYARKVVNNLKNEIVSAGKIASLTVDKKNPVSNRLYESLGFQRLFAQGEYRRV